MPATSEKMRRLFCIALGIKRGSVSRSKSPEAAKLADQMSEKQLSDFCRAPVEKPKAKKDGFIRR